MRCSRVTIEAELPVGNDHSRHTKFGSQRGILAFVGSTRSGTERCVRKPHGDDGGPETGLKGRNERISFWAMILKTQDLGTQNRLDFVVGAMT